VHVQDELNLDLSGWHPGDCPCKQCQDELEQAGSEPVQLLPASIVKAQFPEMWAMRRQLGLLD
jgi:hypothetical protein